MHDAQRPVGPRDLARVFSAVHNVTYYATEISAFTDAGMRGWWMAYFAYRAAPLGAVPAEVVVATFYNFAPRMVQRAVPQVWEVMSPVQIMELRDQCVDRALRRLLAGHLDDPELAEAAQLARHAIEGCPYIGRALYAGYAALPWPQAPHRVLWHACTLLREHRGDSHSIALAAAAVDGVEANALMVARGHGNKASILPIRGWTSEEWDAGVSRLVARGWLNPDGSFTEQGRAARREIEAHTDRLASEPFQRLGTRGVQRLTDLATPYVELLQRGGIVTVWPPTHLLRPEA
jgi:hypothetical protein